MIGCAATGNHHQAAAAAATVAASALLSQASSDSEPSRYRIRLSGSQANVLSAAGIDAVTVVGSGPHKKSSERDTHSAVSSSKHQHGLFIPMQNMRQNVSEKVAQVCMLVTAASYCIRKNVLFLYHKYFMQGLRAALCGYRMLTNLNEV